VVGQVPRRRAAPWKPCRTGKDSRAMPLRPRLRG